MRIAHVPDVIDFDPFATRVEAEATQGFGELIQIGDGRNFRHAKAGGSNISPGKLQVAPAQKTNHHNCTAIASAIYTTTPTFTLGATALVAGEYDEGFLSINVTPDVGRTYKIARINAVASGGTANPTLYEGIQTAWTTATRVSLVHNAFNGVIEDTSAQRRAAGVPMVAILTGDYGWVQTKGVAAVLCDTATTLGAPQIAGAVAGSIKDQTDILGASSETTVAWADIMAGANTEYRPVTLIID